MDHEQDSVYSRSNSTDSGHSSYSIRSSQSYKLAHSNHSESGASVYSSNSISSERSISPPRLLRTESQNSSSARGSSRTQSPARSFSEQNSLSGDSRGSTASISYKSERSQSVESGSRKGSFSREDSINSEENQNPEEQIDSLNEGILDICDSNPSNSAIVSKWLCDSAELQRGRGYTSGRGDECTITISRSLASNLGSVLVKTAGLTSAVHKVIDMPINGCVGGVRNFGEFLQSKKVCQSRYPQFNDFYKKEWAPVILQVAGILDDLFEYRGYQDHAIGQFVEQVDKNFDIVDKNYHVIVEAVATMEEAIIELSKKRVSFKGETSRFQSLEGKFEDLKNELPSMITMLNQDAIKHEVKKQLRYGKHAITGGSGENAYAEAKEILNNIRIESDILRDQMENFRGRMGIMQKYSEFLGPAKSGYGNLIRDDLPRTGEAEMWRPQPKMVGQPGKDVTFVDVQGVEQENIIPLTGTFDVQDATHISTPSESLPLVASFQWKTTDKSNVIIKTLDFPESIIKGNAYLKRDFERFVYFSCKNIEIIVSTTSVLTQGGHLAVTWDSMSVAKTALVVDSVSLSNQPTIVIPAGDSCTKIIKVPFVSIHNLLVLSGKRKSLISMGSLHFHPLNALQAPEGVSGEVNIKIYVRFIEPTYLVQTIIHEMYPKAVVQVVESVVSVNKSVVAPSTPEKREVKPVKEYSLENPYKKYPERYYSIYSNDPAAAEWNRAYDKGLIIKRDYDSIQVYPENQVVFGGMVKDFDLKDHINENIIHMGSWKSADSELILQLNCSPSEFVRKDNENFIIPSLCHLAGLYKHWKGSLIYSFTFGTNSLSRGKLKIMSLPETYVFTNPSYEDMMMLPGSIYDLCSADQTVEIVVPFNNANEFHYTNVEYFGDASYHGEMILTKLYVYVVDPLMTNIGSNNQIDYFVTVRPGPDFEFCTPVGLNMGFPHAIKAMNVEDIKQDGATVGPIEASSKAKNDSGVSTGSKMQLRRGYLFVDTLSGRENITFNVGPVLQKIPISDNPTSWLSSMHVRWRGSLQYEFIISGHDVMQEKGAYIYYIPFGYETPDDVIRDPNYMPAAGQVFDYWNFRDTSIYTLKVNWTSPMKTLLVANEKFGTSMPDKMMFNGRLCVSFVGQPLDKVDIACFIKPGEDFELFDSSFLKTVGKSTPKVLAFSQYKLVRAVDELPVDKSNYVMSMPWPVTSSMDSTKKLAPTTGEIAEYSKADGNKLRQEFIKAVKAAKDKKTNKGVAQFTVTDWTDEDEQDEIEGKQNKIDSVVCVQDTDDSNIVKPQMFENVIGSISKSAAKGVLGEDNVESLADANIPEMLKNIDESAKKVNDTASKLEGLNFDLLKKMIEQLMPIMDQAEKHIPDILQQTTDTMPDVSGTFKNFNQIGAKIIEWASSLISSTFPGWINQLREQGNFVLAIVASSCAILVFFWWYKRPKDIPIPRLLVLIGFVWAPLLGEHIYTFMMWLYNTFKSNLESLGEYVSQSFTETEKHVAGDKSVAPPCVVAELFDEKTFVNMFRDVSQYMRPIFTLITTVISLMAFGKLPQKGELKLADKFKQYADRMGQITSMIKFMEIIKGYSDKLGPQILQWFCSQCGVCLPEDIKIQLGVEYDIKDFLKEAAECSLEENIHKLVNTTAGRARIIELFKQSEEIKEAMISKRLDFKYTLLLTPALNACRTMMNEIYRSKGKVGVRPDPFMIVLFGAPGGGKSSTTEMLIEDLCDLLGYPKENRLYSRNAGTPHWNGYDHQPVILYDDLGQVKSKSSNSDISEIINVKSNCPFEVPMASLEEKGKYCTSEMIIASTNMENLDHEIDIREKGAYYRRRDLLVKVSREGEKDPEDLEKGLVFQVHQNTNLAGGVSKNSSEPIGPPMDYATFRKYTYSKAKIHLNKQRKFVETVNKRKSITRENYAESEYEIEMEYRRLFATQNTKVDHKTYKQAIVPEMDDDYWPQENDIELMEPVRYNLDAKVIQRKEYKQMVWSDIEDMYPTLIDLYGGVWIIDHEETFVITPTEDKPKLSEKCIEKCMHFIFNTGPSAGLCEIMKFIPDLELSAFQDIKSKIGKLREDMRLTDLQLSLLDTVKGFMRPNARYILMILSFYNHSFQMVERERRSKKYEEMHSIFEETSQKYCEEEKTWLSSCSKGMKIALAVGAGMLTVGAILGLGIGGYKVLKMFFPDSETNTEFTEEIIDSQEEILDSVPDGPYIAQAGAGDSSGDFRTKYNALSKKILTKSMKNKKGVKQMFKEKRKKKNKSYEITHFETALRIHALAQQAGATEIELKNAGLWKLGKKDLDRLNKDYNEDVNAVLKKKHPKAQVCYSEKVIKQDFGDRTLLESQFGSVVLPKQYEDVQRVIGFDEQESKKCRVERYEIEDKVQFDLAQLIEHGAEPKLSLVIKKHKSGEAQLKKDNMADELIRHTIAEASAQIYFVKKRKSAHVLRVFGSVIVFPAHYLSELREDPEFVLCTNTAIHPLKFNESNLYIYARDQDLVGYDCGSKVQAARDIRKFIMNKEDYVKYQPSPGYLVAANCGTRGQTVFVDWLPRISQIAIKNEGCGIFYDIEEKDDTLSHYITTGFQYPAFTVNGSCGSIIVRNSPIHQRKILGMHVAGRKEGGFGFAECILQEDLDILHRIVSKSGPIINDVVGSYPKNIQVEAQYTDEEGDYLVDTVEYKRSKVYDINMGTLRHLGRLEENLIPREAGKTTIIPTSIHGAVVEVKTEPSILTAYDKRLKPNAERAEDLFAKWSPCADGISKYGSKVKPFEADQIKEVERHLKRKFRMRNNSKMRRQNLTDSEIINGIRGTDYWLPMDMSTSPGYPYVLSRPQGCKGKRYLFEETGKDELGAPVLEVLDEDLARKFAERETAAKLGNNYETVMVENVKDERRKLKKIYEKPATRTFTCLPVDLNMLFRKYFMDFAVMVMELKNELFCKVGINPDSIEWTRLYHQLNNKGGKGFAGDYAKFDGIGMPEIYDSIVNVINDWYGDGCDIIRKTLIHETFHRFSLCEGEFFRIDQGMPSGFPMTVIFNSFMNYYYLALAWMNLTKSLIFEDGEEVLQGSLQAFDKKTEIATYGDDNIVAVEDDVLELYNLISVSKFLKAYGITYTDDQKRPIEESEKYVPIQEVSFLKRTFKRMDKSGILMVGPLDKCSITEQINWIRRCPDEDEAMRNNIKNALYEASLHGENYYNGLADRLRAYFELMCQDLEILDYEDQLVRWWTNLTEETCHSAILDMIVKGSLREGCCLRDIAAFPNFLEFLKELEEVKEIPPLPFDIKVGGDF